MSTLSNTGGGSQLQNFIGAHEFKNNTFYRLSNDEKKKEI